LERLVPYRGKETIRRIAVMMKGGIDPWCETWAEGERGELAVMVVVVVCGRRRAKAERTMRRHAKN